MARVTRRELTGSVGVAVMVVQKKADVTSEVVDGRAVLVPPSGQEIITLNVVGTLIWNALDTARDVESLTECLLDQLTDVEPDELTRDVRAFLRDLQENDLIEGFA